MQKRILIYGAGVIGSTYGGLISKSGHSVTILARNNRLAELKKQGLFLQRTNNNISEKIFVEVISNSELADNYDYVFVTLRNDQITFALPELSKIKSNCFVFMVNNPSGYSEWVNALGYNRVLPAFPGAGGKIENGVVHYKIVSKIVQPTTLGELNGVISPRVKELKRILKNAGFHVTISKNMDVWQKTHVAMVAPLGDVIYFDGGNNYTVSKNKMAIKQMNLALKENFSFLKKSGIGIEPFKLNVFLMLPLFLLNLIMKYVYNTKWAETVISNHALNARPEMESISKEFVELAISKGFKLNEFQKLLRN